MGMGMRMRMGMVKVLYLCAAWAHITCLGLVSATGSNLALRAFASPAACTSRWSCTSFRQVGQRLARPANTQKPLQLHMTFGMDAANMISSLAVVTGVVAIHEAGHFLAATSQGIKVQSFNIGFGPSLLAVNASTDGPEFAIRAFPFGGFVAFPPSTERDDDGKIVKELDDPDLLENRPLPQRALVISGGVLANVLLAFLCSLFIVSTQGFAKPDSLPGVVVSQIINQKGPAMRAGFRPMDVVLSVNGQKLDGFLAVQDLQSLVKKNPLKFLDMEVMHNDGKKEVLHVLPDANEAGKGSIGVTLTQHFTKLEYLKPKDPVELVSMSSQQTAGLVSVIAQGFWRILSDPSLLSDATISGPVGVLRTGAEMAQYDKTALVAFAASLSVNLAVVNSLPFPALDGGQLMLAMLQSISRGKFNRELQERITILAFSLLAFASIYATVADLAPMASSLTSHQSQSQQQQVQLIKE